MTDALQAAGRAIGPRLSALRERIALACARSGRLPEGVTLVGVAKGQSALEVAAAVRAGVGQIGENYFAELSAKRVEVEALLASAADDRKPAGPEAGQILWRMIGGLQRNKVKALLPFADVVDTVDRESLAEELDRRARAAGLVLPISLQVNVSAEPQKSGVAVDSLPQLLDACLSLENLVVTGLMAIPAQTAHAEESRPAFARLRALRDTLRAATGCETLADLSMGMSADFEVAIEEGATLVRVGTALFGPRQSWLRPAGHERSRPPGPTRKAGSQERDSEDQ